MTTTILGAGLAGLSSSFHIGHERCLIFEKSGTHGGHAASLEQFGFTMDHGPHVSFTKSDYVKHLFAENTENCFSEYQVQTRNFFQGALIEHPAQSHLWQVPEPLRTNCFNEMKAICSDSTEKQPSNYRQWLENNYGPTFTDTFPAAYTRKYWTTEPEALSVDWLGPRMPKLNIKQVKKGLIPETYQNLHYITNIRYPDRGGFQSFFEPMAKNAQIHAGQEIVSIDLKSKKIWFANGTTHKFEKLISTIPLPDFINRCQQVTIKIREAASKLDCSQLLLVDVFAPHQQSVPGHWFYVYDEDKLSTRIHCVERLAPGNAPHGWTGVQAEVYFSQYKPYPGNPSAIAGKVARELVDLNLIDKDLFMRGQCKIQWRWSPYANVIFTHERREALEQIWGWLSQYGLEREPDDLDATCDWTRSFQTSGSLAMAGRFAQWKYFWSDDCILRGKNIGINN